MPWSYLSPRRSSFSLTPRLSIMRLVLGMSWSPICLPDLMLVEKEQVLWRLWGGFSVAVADTSSKSAPDWRIGGGSCGIPLNLKEPADPKSPVPFFVPEGFLHACSAESSHHKVSWLVSGEATIQVRVGNRNWQTRGTEWESEASTLAVLTKAYIQIFSLGGALGPHKSLILLIGLSPENLKKELRWLLRVQPAHTAWGFQVWQ